MLAASAESKVPTDGSVAVVGKATESRVPPQRTVVNKTCGDRLCRFRRATSDRHCKLLVDGTCFSSRIQRGDSYDQRGHSARDEPGRIGRARKSARADPAQRSRGYIYHTTDGTR